jgi:hypothetical protein
VTHEKDSFGGRRCGRRFLDLHIWFCSRNGSACAKSWVEYQGSAPPKAFAFSSNGQSCGHCVNRGQAGVTLEGVIARALSNCAYFKGIGCRITASEGVPPGMTQEQALMRRSRAQ